METQLDITKTTDLELAEILDQQMQLLMQVQSNLLALRAELTRRKKAIIQKAVSDASE